MTTILLPIAWGAVVGLIVGQITTDTFLGLLLVVLGCLPVPFILGYLK